MDTRQRPEEGLISLLWKTLRLSWRAIWQGTPNVARPMLLRQQALGVMGLPLNATPQQIKQRYRTLAKKYHPDMGGDPRQMQRLAAAYEYLMKNPLH